MFGKIVAPLDGSALAAGVIPYVVAMTKITDAQITLLQVMVRESTTPTAVSPVEWQLQKSEAQAYLDEMASRLAQLTATTPETVLLEGRAADRIIEYTQQNHCDLIVLSSHGQSGLHGWNVSSIAQKVIHRVGKSILLVRAYQLATTVQVIEGEGVRYRRLVVPLDGSPRAEHVLPVAAALAEAHGAELILVHVVTRPTMLQRMPLTSEENALADHFFERNQTQAHKYFEQLRLRLHPEPQTHVITGDNVAAALHKFISQQEADLVIMSAHGHSGQHQWPYGSLVTGFVDYGATSLLIIQDMAPDVMEPTAAEVAAEAIRRQPLRAESGDDPITHQGMQVGDYVASVI